MMTFAELKNHVSNNFYPCHTIYDFVDEKSVAEVANLAFGRYDDRYVTYCQISYLAGDLRYVEVELA
jgi:hypothetical protein